MPEVKQPSESPAVDIKKEKPAEVSAPEKEGDPKKVLEKSAEKQKAAGEQATKEKDARNALTAAIAKLDAGINEQKDLRDKLVKAKEGMEPSGASKAEAPKEAEKPSEKDPKANASKPGAETPAAPKEKDRFPKIKEELAAAKKILQDPHATPDQKFKAFGDYLAGTFELIGRGAARIAAEFEGGKEIPVDEVAHPKKESAALGDKIASLEAEIAKAKDGKAPTALTEELTALKQRKEGLDKEYARRKEEIPTEFPGGAVEKVEYGVGENPDSISVTFKSDDLVNAFLKSKNMTVKALEESGMKIEGNSIVIANPREGAWSKDPVLADKRKQFFESLKNFPEAKTDEKLAKKAS